MGEQFKLQGAWITPSGNIHWTKHIESHAKVLDELGIAKQLKDLAIANGWKYYDLAEVAMRVGYLRITNYRNQFGVEYGGIINAGQISAIRSVFQHYSLDFWKAAREKISSFTLENFISHKFEQFKTWAELEDKIQKKRNDLS